MYILSLTFPIYIHTWNRSKNLDTILTVRKNHPMTSHRSDESLLAMQARSRLEVAQKNLRTRVRVRKTKRFLYWTLVDLIKRCGKENITRATASQATVVDSIYRQSFRLKSVYSVFPYLSCIYAKLQRNDHHFIRKAHEKKSFQAFFSLNRLYLTRAYASQMREIISDSSLVSIPV